MMSASERWNTRSSGTEKDCRDLMMDEGCSEAVFFFCISYSSAPPLLLLIISPVRPRRPPPRSRVGPPGSYVTCIRILPSGITKATSSQLQLIVSLIDYAADYLCDSLVSFQLCNKIVKKKKKKCCSLPLILCLRWCKTEKRHRCSNVLHFSLIHRRRTRTLILQKRPWVN